MKTNRTIKRLLFSAAFLMVGLVGAYAADPATISAESATLYKHGTNSTGTTDEAIEYVTTGAIMKYFVLPDKNANPSFDSGDPLNAANILSTFTWTTTGATGTATGAIAAVGTNPANYKAITWGGLGTINLNVVENSPTGGCASTTTQTIPVTIIKAPTVVFSSATATSRCGNVADGSLAETLTGIPVTCTTDVTLNPTLKVTYDITCTNPSFTSVSGAVASVSGGTFDVATTLKYYGTYTITVTKINDRISTKSKVDGTVGTQKTYTLTINPAPVTGPIYHIPNN